MSSTKDAYNIAGRGPSPTTVAYGRQSSSLASQAEAQLPSLGLADLFRNRRNLLVLASLGIDNFSVLCTYTMIASFFPTEADKKGVSSTVTGLIFGVFPLVVVLCSPVVGVVIPIIGAKFTLVAGLFVEGCSQIIFGFLDRMPDKTTFVVFSFLVRSTTGLGSSMSTTANLTIVAHTFGQNMAVAFGILEAFLGLGVVAGPPLGGYFYQIGGFQLPFFVLGSLVLVADIVIFFVLSPDSNEGNSHQSGSLLSALRIPAVTVVAVVMLMAGMTISFLDPTLAFHLAKFHLTSGEIGLMFLVMTATYTLSAPWLGVQSGKLDTRLMMTFGSLICGISYIFIGPSPFFHSRIKSKLWVNGLSLALCGFGLSLLFIPSITDMNKSAVAGGMEDSLSTHGVVSGVFNAAINVGATLGPTAAGAFSQYFGFPLATTIIGCFQFVVGIFLWAFTCCERKKGKERETDEEQRPLVQNA